MLDHIRGEVEINNGEILRITFDIPVHLETVEFGRSNGGDNDHVEMLVDGVAFDFSSAFAGGDQANRPEWLANNPPPGDAWYTGDVHLHEPWGSIVLNFSPHGILGSVFEFTQPEGKQAWGGEESEYRVASMEVEPIPEPGTLLLLVTGLVGLAGYGVRRRKKP